MTTDHDHIHKLIHEVHQVTNQLAGLIVRYGPQEKNEAANLLSGLQAVALLAATCTDPLADSRWKHDPRLRLILDEMIAGLGKGFYRSGLEGLTIPDPARALETVSDVCTRYRDLVGRLWHLRDELRPTVDGSTVMAMALRSPGMHVITETSLQGAGGGGMHVAADRTMQAITTSADVADLVARNLHAHIRPPLQHRELMTLSLEVSEEDLHAMELLIDGLAWPTDGGWIGSVAFDDWCTASGINTLAAERAINSSALEWSRQIDYGPSFAEIRIAGKVGNDNYGWMLIFSAREGFEWREHDWQD